MPASAQEELVSEFSRWSLGAVSLFEPDPYRKGSGHREPADLAWSCRDAVVLMNMQENGESQSAQDKHNVNQLDGWMRIWSQGAELTGRNEIQRFSIPLDQVATVLLISVTSDPSADLHLISGDGRKLPELAARKLSATFSVPERVLMALAKAGGSATDFVDVLLRVAAGDGTATAEEAIRFLYEHRESAKAKALSAEEVRSDRDVDLDDLIYSDLGAILRASVPQGGVLAQSRAIEVFNDLDWELVVKLALFLADTMRVVRDVGANMPGPLYAAKALDLGAYRFVVSAEYPTQDQKGTQAIADFARKLLDERPDRPPIGIHYQLQGRPQLEYARGLLVLTEHTSSGATANALRQLRGYAGSGAMQTYGSTSGDDTKLDAENPLSTARLTLDRARDDLLDVGRQILAFFSHEPDRVVGHVNEDGSGDIRFSGQIPPEWGPKIERVLKDLRTCLNQIGLASAQTMDPRHEHQASFPIVTSEASWNEYMRAWPQPSSEAGQSLHELIARFQPYQQIALANESGSTRDIHHEPLWVLDQLSSQNQNQTNQPRIVLATRGTQSYLKESPRVGNVPQAPRAIGFITAPVKTDHPIGEVTMVDAGVETWRPIYVQIRFDVCFDRRGEIPDRLPVLETLSRLVSYMSNMILPAFETAFRSF